MLGNFNVYFVTAVVRCTLGAQNNGLTESPRVPEKPFEFVHMNLCIRL